MKVLEMNQVEEVNGGGRVENALYKFATGKAGATASNLARAKAITSAGGMVGAAAYGGYRFGTAVNNKYGTQIGDAIWKVTSPLRK